MVLSAVSHVPNKRMADRRCRYKVLFIYNDDDYDDDDNMMQELCIEVLW